MLRFWNVYIIHLLLDNYIVILVTWANYGHCAFCTQLLLSLTWEQRNAGPAIFPLPPPFWCSWPSASTTWLTLSPTPQGKLTFMGVLGRQKKFFFDLRWQRFRKKGKKKMSRREPWPAQNCHLSVTCHRVERCMLQEKRRKSPNRETTVLNSRVMDDAYLINKCEKMPGLSNTNYAERLFLFTL